MVQWVRALAQRFITTTKVNGQYVLEAGADACIFFVVALGAVTECDVKRSKVRHTPLQNSSRRVSSQVGFIASTRDPKESSMQD